MNLRQIELALAVADEGSFTRAAARCHTVQSALSHQVARLEQELGAQLFERTSRHVRLTPAGETFAHHARLALDATRRIRDEVAVVSGEVRGNLSIGTISSLTVIDLVDLLAVFHSRYSHVDIRLNTGGSEILLDDVRERRMDVAFIGLWLGEKIEGVQLRRIAVEELVAVLPLGHPLSSCPRLPLEALADLPMVEFQSGSSARRQTDEAFNAMGVHRRVHFEVGHMSQVEKLVRRGLAVGLVPARVATEFTGVVQVPVFNAPVRALYFVWSKTPTPAAKAFVELLTAELDKVSSTASDAVATV